ncbi:exo-alpha-sialidase [Jiangella muralis]|uniref:exo-alpha-sialidase n=1 Tax=Jiangella muralis TaxID=702383 RepID=UPI00146FF486|nr:exo-alpha-sialidase [Jiangella muralis]
MRRALAAVAVTACAVAGTVTGGAPATATDIEPATPTWATSELIEKVTVWEDGESGTEAHRIPGIAVTNEGTVLAVSEARHGITDTATHELVYKRSLDGGRTWPSAGTIEASPNRESWVNPTLLVDQRTGRIFLFYNLNYQGVTGDVFYRYSDDDGRTWSERTEITSMFRELPQGWTNHSPGPGHGLQLSDGRLILQVWHRKSVELPAAERGYSTSVIYSDDLGATWHNGGAIPIDPAYPNGETRLLERADGTLALYGRYAVGSPNRRIVSISDDRGATWSEPYLHGSFPPAAGADAGLDRLSGGPGSADVSRVVFSRPSTASRRDLSLALSYDDGYTFPREKVVQTGRVGYSDIAVLDDGTVLVLYEVVPEIIVARLNVEWLTDSRDSLVAGPGLTRHLFEAENADAAASPAPSVVDDRNSSGGQRLEFAAAEIGDHLDLEIEVPDAGTYDLNFRLLNQADRASVQVSVDGHDLGDPIDASTEKRIYSEASLDDVALAAGTHTIRLSVTGQGPESTGLAIGLDYVSLTRFDPPPPPPACDETVTGTHHGPLAATGVLCLDGASVKGPVMVTGGALLVTDSRVDGPVRVTGARQVVLCASEVTGPLAIQDVAETVVLGGVACAPNTLRGPVAVQDSNALIRIVGNTVNGSVYVAGNSGTTAAVVAANEVTGPLACAGNTPSPVNDGHPNSAAGARSGQCAEL